MKKLLACGLIMSTLMSIGSVCVARGHKPTTNRTASTFIARFEWDTKGRKSYGFDSFIKIDDVLLRKIGSAPL